MDETEEKESQALDLRSLKVISVLGRGGKGVVFLVRNESNETLALKVISKALIQNQSKKSDDNNSNRYKRIWFERDVLKLFNHPLLPRLHGFVFTDTIVGFAIDYCSGGNLNSLRMKQSEKMFSDEIIRFYAAELVLGLEYLHGLGIVYRDLKPENIMIQENGHLMLVDFDLSTKLSVKSPKNCQFIPSMTKKKKRSVSFYLCFNSGVSPELQPASRVESVVNSERFDSDSDEKSNSFVGTEEYMAPEIILGKGHDFAVDWWSLGVVLYEMLYGNTPFRGSNRKETYYRILTKSPDLMGDQTVLRDLIGRLLEKDPAKRLSSIEDIKGHDFFCGVDWDSLIHISSPPFIPPVKTHEDYSVEYREGSDFELFLSKFETLKNDTYNKVDDRSNKRKEDVNKGDDFSNF